MLAESGLRLGEALGLQHRDWHTGRGDTPFIEVVFRENPHMIRAKSGFRRPYVSDEVDRLYGEYEWQLCEPVRTWPPTTSTPPVSSSISSASRRFAPCKPDSVYDLVDRLHRDLAGQVPAEWTPH